MSTTHKQKFEEKTIPKLQKELGVKNPMAIPRLQKIVVNTSSQQLGADKKEFQKTAEDLAAITGQKPKITKAKVSVSAFKLREGMDIGLMVTLRGTRMYEFYEKIVKIVLPRVKDFNGVDDKALDGRGNMSIGFSEHVVFPEIDPGQIEKARSLQVTFVTTAQNNEEARKLFSAMEMPFVKKDTEKTN